jgi:hypothetical protein
MHILVAMLVLVSTVACEGADPRAVTLRGSVVASPVCPVVGEPPDPACADRPVAGAELVVRDAVGESIARIRSDDAGAFAVSLVPGSYTIVPQPVDGLMGTAPSVEVVLTDGADPAHVVISYDTGIR